MTTMRRYKCNFCGTETDDYAEMHGMYWASDKVLIERQAYECESHLCPKCLTAISVIGQQYVDINESMTDQHPQ